MVNKHGFRTAVVALLALPMSACMTFNIYSSDQDDPDVTIKQDPVATTVEVKPKSKDKKPVSLRFLNQGDDEEPVGLALIPGFYWAYRDDVQGFETSLLYNGLGIASGFERGRFKYLELEYATLVTLGVGFRQTEGGGSATQVTWSLPIFFVFPYGRKIWNDPDHSYEVGLMAKVPIYDFRVHAKKG